LAAVPETYATYVGHNEGAAKQSDWNVKEKWRWHEEKKDKKMSKEKKATKRDAG